MSLEIELCVNNKQLKVDKFWLRDHCRCENCYYASSSQRRIDIMDLPDDINTKSVEISGDKLLVTWDDGHESAYDFDFLLRNQRESLVENAPKKVLWTKDIMSDENAICRVQMRDYMSDSNVSLKVLESLHSHGFAFIDGVQPTEKNTEFVIRQLFPIHRTLFGDMWQVSDENNVNNHEDTAYTNAYLGPHNDNTYFNDASGLQSLHCTTKQCTGGENFLIDGYQVAAKIRKNHPEAFERLTKTVVPAEYIEKGKHHKYCAPIINLDPVTKEVIQIRYNMHDRAPLNTILSSEVRQFYKDLKVLISEMENPENRIDFMLEPGTVLLFDNWRLLHGRNSYNGRRSMTGCYVLRTEFLSALRLNGIID